MNKPLVASSSARMKLKSLEEKELELSSELMDLVLCPVCYDLPEGPIHNCSKGHVICSKCRPRVAKCGFCKSAYSDTSRNYPLESIAQFIRSRKTTVIIDGNSPSSGKRGAINCPYRPDGCDVRLPADQIDKHCQNCEFRPIECPLKVPNGGWCSSSDGTILFKNYFQHLKSVHRVQELLTTLLIPGRFVKEDHVYTELEINVSWPLLSMNFDGKQFIRQAFIRNRAVYWNIYLVGAESEVTNYKAEIILLQSQPQLGKVPGKIYNISVLPIRSLGERSTPSTDAVIGISEIRKYSEVNKVIGKRVAKFTWRTAICLKLSEG